MESQGAAFNVMNGFSSNWHIEGPITYWISRQWRIFEPISFPKVRSEVARDVCV